MATGAITDGCAYGQSLEAWDTRALAVPGAAAPDSEAPPAGGAARGLGVGPLQRVLWGEDEDFAISTSADLYFEGAEESTRLQIFRPAGNFFHGNQAH